MEDKIVKIGRIRIIGLITLASMIASVIITWGIYYFNERDIDFFVMSISVGIPLVVAPSVSWYAIGLLINYHKLEQEMRKLANVDDLTGLMTRRAFLENYQSIYWSARRSRTHLSFVYIDIDNFKDINDSFGHAGGDKVLASFSSFIKQHKRKSDLSGRIGGEEFAMVLPDTDLQGALQFSKKLLKIAGSTHVLFNETSIDYTISIGVATNEPERYCEFELLMDLSDKALYRSKKAGKNCVTGFTASGDRPTLPNPLYA